MAKRNPENSISFPAWNDSTGSKRTVGEAGAASPSTARRSPTTAAGPANRRAAVQPT